MARITSKIAIAAAALPTGVFTAIEKARSSVQPQPPTPDTWDAVSWMLTGQDPLAAFIAVASGISGGWAIWQMFQPSPATPDDVKTDGRTTRAGVEHVSTQIAAEGQASDANHGLTHQLLAGELPKRVEVAAAAGLFSDEASKRIFDAVASRVGAEQAQRTVEQVEEVAERGDQRLTDLLASGAFAEAAAYQRSLAEQGDQRQAQAWRDTARISVLTSVEQAIRDYARSTDLDPTNFWTWIELARLHMAAGSLMSARRAAEVARQHASDDRETMVASGALGDFFAAQGDLAAAGSHYHAALRAAEAGALANPSSFEWQRDLSVSHNKLGDLAVAQRDMVAAATAYRFDLSIAKELAAGDPANTEWQRDLSVSHNKVGDVAMELGDLDGAAAEYRAGLTIREALAASDPRNLRWQRDLAVSHGRLGDVAMDQGDVAAAAEAYGRSQNVYLNLAEFDASNTDWQRDLSISYNKRGDVMVEQGDLSAAAIAYSKGIAIAEALTAHDPGIAEWQRDLFICHTRLARLAEANLDISASIEHLESAEMILLGLLTRIGDHPTFKRDLMSVRAYLARLRAQT